MSSHARPWDLKPQQRNLTPVLRRPVEPATPKLTFARTSCCSSERPFGRRFGESRHTSFERSQCCAIPSTLKDGNGCGSVRFKLSIETEMNTSRVVHAVMHVLFLKDPLYFVTPTVRCLPFFYSCPFLSLEIAIRHGDEVKHVLQCAVSKEHAPVHDAS